MLKDEINQLKNLTKEANTLIVNKSDKPTNSGISGKITQNIQDQKTTESHYLVKEPKFLQIESPKIDKQPNKPSTSYEISSQQKHQKNETEEEIKEEFEEKFTYLLNKLDVIYQISDNNN